MPLASASRAPRGQTSESGHVPAPVGGINTVDVGSQMPPLDANYLWNLLPAEYGLRSRLGWREWCTGLTGYADNQVRSVLSFTGNGISSPRTFACTSSGIWDVTNSSASPTLVQTFTYNGATAGYGSSTVYSTPAGRFLIYCDEENGLFIWSETAAAWNQVAFGATVQWLPNTEYAVGELILNTYSVGGGFRTDSWSCSVAGTSAASGGPTFAGLEPDGVTCIDGTVQWSLVGSDLPADVISGTHDDQFIGLSGDPANFVQVTVFKNRLWFVERDTSRAWYLNTNAVYGTATSFDFGAKMRTGGSLRGLFNWSYDGGAGLDTLLVGVSSNGDVVIYQGTDPESAATFGIKGCWSVGAVPYGRRLATENGGDLLIMSNLGVVAASKLVLGNVEPNAVYATAKISNLFNQLATTLNGLPGWSIHVHPTDNALLVTVPTTGAAATQQLAMSFGTKGWTRYRDLPIFSAGVSNGELYFGTVDGRVCRNVDYMDGITLADPSSYTAIAWSGMTAYRNLGNSRVKQVKSLRPIVLGGQAALSLQATAKYDYDLIEPAAPSANVATSGFDYDVWDTATWDADYRAVTPVQGAVGMGRDVAIAFRGSSVTRCVFVGCDVVFEQGGFL